jgi:hypothetical protein
MESILQYFILYFICEKYNMNCYVVLFTLFAVLGVMSLNRHTGIKKVPKQSCQRSNITERGRVAHYCNQIAVFGIPGN